MGWRASLEILKEMKKTYPNDIEMNHIIGDIYYYADHFDSAIVYFEKVTMMGHVRSLHHLCYSYLQLGQFEKLVEVAKRWVHIEGSQEADYMLAIATRFYDKKIKLEVGEAILKTAQEFRPNDKEILVYMGMWYFDQGQFDSAAVYLERVMEMDPTHKRMLAWINMTYEELGLYEKEFEAAKLQMSVRGSDYFACYSLAKATALSGKFEEGIKALDQVRELFPKRYYATRFIADLYAHQEQYTRAEAELNSLIEEDQPPEAKQMGYSSLTRLYPYMGRFQEALDAADKAIELYYQAHDTSNAIKWTAIKGLIGILGGKEMASKAIGEEKEYSLFQRRYGLQKLWLDLGLIQFYLENYVAADSIASHLYMGGHQLISSLIQMEQDCAVADSIDNHPGWRANANCVQIQIFYHLARCYYENGEFDKARRSLARWRSKWGPKYSRPVFYPKSFYLQGKIHEKKGDRKKAIQNYEKLLDLWKNADEDLPELLDAKNRLAELKKEI